MCTQNKTCRAFITELASKAPTPGGGGASALVGAVASALASMVGNLTVGKKRYAAHEDEIKAAIVRAGELSDRLLALADEDAEAFLPLAKAYSIPKDAPERAEIMEKALFDACVPPVGIMECACEIVALCEMLAEKGSALALSDVAVSASCAKAALVGASMNVYINAASMTDRAKADGLTGRADAMIAEYAARAEKVTAAVLEKIR